MSKYIFHRFDSIAEFCEASAKNRVEVEASSRVETPGNNRYGEAGEPWAGTSTYEEALEFATRGGWEPEMAVEFRNIFDQYLPSLRKFHDVEFARTADVSGSDVNMDAYLEGDPDCMFEWFPTDTETTKRALCVLIGHSISSSVSGEELFQKGQAVVGLIRALQMLGYELEIWSEQTVTGGGRVDEMFSVLTNIHHAGEVMDQSAVEFAVGNPGWLRRLVFGLEEGMTPTVRKRYGFGNGGYGTPQPVKHADLVNADVTLALGSSWWRNGYDDGPEDVARKGFQWVIDQLKAFGVIDEDAEVDF